MRRVLYIAILLVVLSLACNFSSSTSTDEEAAPPDTTQPDAPKQPKSEKPCGDGTCDGPENPNNCPQDCSAEAQPGTTPLPTQPAPTSAPSSSSSSSTPCNRASFLADVTVPDGTTYSPGDTFTKTWRLKNTGTCPWTSNFKLAFESGELMGASPKKPLTTSPVTQGQNLDISVNLSAPSSPGTYRGTWKIENASGDQIAIENSANNTFWVEIVVTSGGVPAPVSPSFSIAYDNTHSCSGNDYATFKITNTGSKDFNSLNIRLIDLDTSTTLLHVSGINPFILNANGCGPGNSTAQAGGVYYVIANLGSSPPSGHNARAILRLCTEPALAGTCVMESTTFTVP